MKTMMHKLVVLVVISAALSTTGCVPQSGGGLVRTDQTTISPGYSASQEQKQKNWLQPESGHTNKGLREAYADGVLDRNDSVYYVGNRIVERWLSAPLRPGALGSEHGYREGFLDIEIMVFEQNTYVTREAKGKYPSEYWRPLLDGYNGGQVKLGTECQVHIRFSETGWMPPGLYPLRGINMEHVGAVEMVVVKTYPQAKVPLFGGFVTMVIPTDPIEKQNRPKAQPTVSVGVFRDGKQIPLRFLPKGNTSNRIISATRSSPNGRVNDLKAELKTGGYFMPLIVPPGACTNSNKEVKHASAT